MLFNLGIEIHERPRPLNLTDPDTRMSGGQTGTDSRDTASCYHTTMDVLISKKITGAERLLIKEYYTLMQRFSA